MTTRYIGAMPKPILRQPALALVLLGAFAACRGDQGKPQKVAQSFQLGEQAPDEVPKMLNTDPPFRYPAALYARKVQGNVTLRLRIDTNGRALPDSTRVEEKSGYPELDSAAIKGASELQFVPAKRAGEPVPVTILFPVYFRHPEARPLPGDTILKQHAADTGAAGKAP